jgi:asparagine synthase (glutamine-hydrolysing)
MCGIAGIYNRNADTPIDRKVLEAMTDSLSHRGPDDKGCYIDNNIGLGHRRLSIIDLGGGKQPMCNENRQIQVVFNGEIFNYIELMDYLKTKGHVFRTRSDTEVIVHLYEEYGLDFLTHLNGQFAIALWDNTTRELLLARDRMGIRPLYFSERKKGTVLFGSEAKAIFCYPGLSRCIDPIGLEQALTLWVTVPPRTIFKGIRELPPGCFLRVTKEKTSLHRYWRHSFPDKGGYEDKPFTCYTERLQELLYDAATIRLRADVPVAAYLSGGLDSSIIASLIRKYHNNHLKTFSVSFKDTAYDEGLFQQEMVRFLNTDHRVIEMDYDAIGELFSDVVWYAESPMIRTAPAPLYALSGLVRQNNIKVVLTGEGADEVFGGYNIFKENKIRRFWSRFPQSPIRPLLLSRLYPYIKASAQAGNFWQLFFKKGLADTENPYYSHTIRWSNTARIKRLLSLESRESLDEQQHIYGELDEYIDPEMKRWDPLCQSQYLEMVLFMSGYLLSSQGDRMMMGHSVEGRFPFLDHRVVEFAATIPPEYKLNLLNEKWILKKTFEHILPQNMVQRPKQPYRAPIAKCFIGKGQQHVAASQLNYDAVVKAGIFDPESIKILTEKSKNSTTEASALDDMTIAAVTSTQLLYHHFISDFKVPAMESFV